MRLTNKGPHNLGTSALAGSALLDGVSKAALVEAYLQTLARANGTPDVPPTREEVAKDIGPVLAIRKDRKFKVKDHAI
jgi:hypothetical protein